MSSRYTRSSRTQRLSEKVSSRTQRLSEKVFEGVHHCVVSAVEVMKDMGQALSFPTVDEYFRRVDDILEAVEGREINPYASYDFRLMVKAVGHASLIYSMEAMCKSLTFYTRLAILSFEEKSSSQVPDVVATYDPLDGTKSVWVTCRGTSNVDDAAMDLAWLVDFEKLGNIVVPRGPGKRATEALVELKRFLDVLSKETRAKPKEPYEPPERIIFCGHSLGGAVAAIMCLKYLMDTKAEGQEPLDFLCITLASPQFLACPIPLYLQLEPSSPKHEFADFQNKNYNIVQRLDIVPRLCMSPALQALQKIHHGYTPVGSYYSLNPAHDGRKRCSFRRVTDESVTRLLSSQGFAKDTLLDHKSETALDALRSIAPIDAPPSSSNNPGNFHMIPYLDPRDQLPLPEIRVLYSKT